MGFLDLSFLMDPSALGAFALAGAPFYKLNKPSLDFYDYVDKLSAAAHGTCRKCNP